MYRLYIRGNGLASHCPSKQAVFLVIRLNCRFTGQTNSQLASPNPSSVSITGQFLFSAALSVRCLAFHKTSGPFIAPPDQTTRRALSRSYGTKVRRYVPLGSVHTANAGDVAPVPLFPFPNSIPCSGPFLCTHPPQLRRPLLQLSLISCDLQSRKAQWPTRRRRAAMDVTKVPGSMWNTGGKGGR